MRLARTVFLYTGTQKFLPIRHSKHSSRTEGSMESSTCNGTMGLTSCGKWELLFFVTIPNVFQLIIDHHFYR